MKAYWVSASTRLMLAAAALWLASGCTTMAADTVNAATESVSDAINQRDVKSHAVRSIKTISINRVAVMPLIEPVVESTASATIVLHPGAIDSAATTSTSRGRIVSQPAFMTSP